MIAAAFYDRNKRYMFENGRLNAYGVWTFRSGMLPTP